MNTEDTVNPKDFKPTLTLSDLPNESTEMKVLLKEYSIDEVLKVLDKEPHSLEKGLAASALAKTTGNTKAMYVSAMWHETEAQYGTPEYLEGASILYSLLAERHTKYLEDLTRVEKMLKANNPDTLTLSEMRKMNGEGDGDGDENKSSKKVCKVNFGRTRKPEELSDEERQERHNYKLGFEMAEAIRQKRREGWTYLRISERFGCHQSMIGKIIRRECWTDPVTPYHKRTKGNSKLDKDKVVQIRKLSREGLSLSQIQKKFPEVGRTSVRRVIIKETWAHIDDDGNEISHDYNDSQLPE